MLPALTQLESSRMTSIKMAHPRDLGSAFTDDSLRHPSGLDAPMQLNQFEGGAWLAFQNPFLFNMDEIWDVFSNILA